jgi:hypothetical protein
MAVFMPGDVPASCFFGYRVKVNVYGQVTRAQRDVT